MKFTKRVLLLLFLFTAPILTFARDMSKKENVDVKEILWGHIKDSYEWHITDLGSEGNFHPLVIHLPIIVKSSTGWHIFSSSMFSEERDANGDRPGPYNLVIKNGNDKANPNLIVEKIGDPAPRGFIGLMHMFIMNIYDEVIKPCLGDDTPKYAPWLLTCFFFIFFANLMGLVPFPPGGGNLTGNITCTFFLGTCTFLITNFTGTKEYWKEIFWPDVPTWMKFPIPLMPIIELFGIFTKPLALIVRLFANTFAGHAIALCFCAIIFIMFSISNNALVNWSAGTSMSIIGVLLSIFMMLLEILVSYIQALVFTMLSAVFISQAHVKEHKA